MRKINNTKNNTILNSKPSLVSVDDINDDGNLDLLVGTLNGQVHLLETRIPYHPMNSWTSFVVV